MKLIVGLGNPGKEYEYTRHNVGFLILDNCYGKDGWKEKFNGYYKEININGIKTILLKPTTFMNLSGNAVRKYADFFKIDHNDVLIIQDDLDLPILKYKLKYKSSSGGHNGIKSIISSLGTDEIPRLKVGIANKKNVDTKDYVLGKINKEIVDELKKNTNLYKEIIEEFINTDIQECMQKYNKK